MINYIIQVLLFQTLFLAMYDFFLSKETFFAKNRWYLLATSIVSFVLPLIKIPTFQRVVPEEITILLPEIVLSPQSFIEQTTIYQSIDYLDILFITGLSIFFMIFLVKLYKLSRLIIKYKIEDKGSYKLIILPGTKKAFSFFHYVFLGGDINDNERVKIIEHELIHSKQKHTYDLLFFELLKVVMWFNPLVYVYQKRIATVHEYISDATVVKSTPKETYINKLINELFDVENITFVNQFSKHSLIKKRIIMITKKKSKEIKQAKYLLLLPILLSMLFYTACSDKNLFEVENTKVEKELQTIYTEFKDGVTERKGKKMTYMDYYMGIGKPKGIEVDYKDLSYAEKEELNAFKYVVDSIMPSKQYGDNFNYKVYDNGSSRKVYALSFDFSQMKKEKKETTSTDGNDISFMIIDKIPTFPGCEDNENDKKCFNRNLQKHFAENFNSSLPNKLELSPGKKRLIILFKIDKEGNIRDIKAKAPHRKLEEESIRIINMLPKMIPGEQDGKPVGVKYTLPMRIDVQ